MKKIIFILILWLTYGFTGVGDKSVRGTFSTQGAVAHNTVLIDREIVPVSRSKKSELLEQIFFASLERIFIEKKIYRHIEDCNHR